MASINRLVIVMVDDCIVCIISLSVLIYLLCKMFLLSYYLIYYIFFCIDMFLEYRKILTAYYISCDFLFLVVIYSNCLILYLN